MKKLFFHGNPDKRVYYVLGALVFVIILVVVALPTIKKYSANERILFEKYYEPYAISKEIDIHDPVFHDVTGAVETYTKGKYFESIIRFQKLMEYNPELVFIKFFLGLSYIETNQYRKAEAILEELTDAKGNNYQYPAIWYLALLHLKQNQNEEAREYLTMLLQDKNEYSVHAREILNSLN